MSKPKLCFVTAVPMTVNAFLRAHIERLVVDYEVFVVSDFTAGAVNVPPSVTCLSVPMARDISLGKDIRGLRALVALFRRHHFDIVLSVTPKAGLLTMLAGFLAQVPCRIHWFTGQVWVTRQGAGRLILKSADRLIAGLASTLLADSPSQREFLVEQGVVRANKISVIADGSICGVDSERFCPNAEARKSVRASFGIPDAATLVLYLGRLNVDKGLNELAGAMLVLGERFPAVHWLFVGPDEGNMADEIRLAASRFSDRLHFQGFTTQPETFMAAADLFCLPSYREGFGSSILEAAAAGIPGVATRIYGLTDAVEDGVTGLLVPPRDVDALTNALSALLQDGARRDTMGKAARQRAVERFGALRIVEGLAAFLAERQGRRRG
jgi:glycosyltransferase involved in cell wall biosynthesis